MDWKEYFRNITNKVEARTEPILDLAKAIITCSFSLADKLKPEIAFTTDKEKNESWVMMLFESQQLIIHLVSRQACMEIGPTNRSAMLESLAEPIIETTISSVFGHWPENLRDGIRNDYYSNLASTEVEYGSCVLTTSECENLNNYIFHRFAKNIVQYLGNESNLGLILDVQRMLMEELVRVQYSQKRSRCIEAYRD